MIQKLTGIVIRETKINEADKMLTVLTGDMGPVSVVAKNIRKNKSKISAAAGFLCYSDFVLSGGPDVYYISQCSLVESFFNISEDIQKLALATYFGSLAADLSPVGEPQHEVLKLLLNTLHILSNTDKNIFLVKSVFELRLMMCQGYMPDVFVCAKCGEENLPYFFDINDSNIKCSKCASKGIEISEPILYAMRYILNSEAKKIFSFDLNDDLCRKLADLTKAYILNVLGYFPKTLQYFESLI